MQKRFKIKDRFYKRVPRKSCIQLRKERMEALLNRKRVRHQTCRMPFRPLSGVV